MRIGGTNCTSTAVRLFEPVEPQIIGQAIEATPKGGGNRDAVAPVFDAPGMTLLSGEPDPVHARHALALPKIVDEHVNLVLECLHVAEGRNVDRNDRLSGIGGARVVMIVVDHLL